MLTDRDIQEAIAIGERNRATVELVRNWCAHARIEKFGGVGLIEQQTGLPIGCHSMKCDHASEAGIASWDLREGALDFHDRNCADCKLRRPVGFPNLSILLKERDERRQEEAKRKAAIETREANAFAARRLKREQLKETVGPISSAIVDHIDEFDEYRNQEHRDRICESARLAPEHFVAPLVTYLIEATENEPWFADTGLTVLHEVKADPTQLARLALLAVAHAPTTRTAARVLLDTLEHIDKKLIPEALPPIIELANPSDEPFLFEHRPRAEPELLQALWKAYPGAVREGLDQLLSSRQHHYVDLAARGILSLLEIDTAAASSFVRTMVSKYARARLLIENFDDDRQHLRPLQDAIAGAFRQSPDAVDAIIQQMINGSDTHSRGRAYEIYRTALGYGRSRKRVPVDSPMHRLAFQRLLWAATTEDSDDILRTVQSVFRSQPYELEDIARAELDKLLGALLILDDRLRKHDEKPRDENEIFLKALERRNRRSTIVGIMSSLVEWTSAAASGNPVLIKKIVDMIEAIPEGRDTLKGLLLGSIEHLGKTVEGLKLLLPHLYYGLVGPSVLLRSYAATALGELHYSTRKNVPPLVYEAFSLLLGDQYVAVHKAAVRALRRFSLPDDCRNRAAQALLNLIQYYSQKSGEDRFVVECVHLFAGELHRLGKPKSKLAQYLVQVLLKTDPLYVRSELRVLAHTLGQTDGFADLLIRHLPEMDDDHYGIDDEVALLAELPVEAILAKRSKFEKLGLELAPQRPWLACYVVETLSRAGAWAEARRVAQAGVDGSEPTFRNRSRRIYSRFIATAAEFEQAIAEGRTEDLPKLSKQWTKNLQEQLEHNADVEKRNSRASFPSSL